MDNPLGFSHFLAQADLVSRTILVLMAAASLTSWYLIVTKLIAGAKARARSARFLEFFWNAPSLDAVAEKLEGSKPDNAFAHLAQQGLVAMQHHDRHGAHRLHEAGTTSEYVTRALRRTIDEETAAMESGLTILASIGSTSPFVGLLGTVWGIYHALLAIGMSGSGTLDKVAGPVGEALIMTAIGLAVAIPAVLGYNFIVRSNRITQARLDGFAHDLYTFLVTGAKVGAPQPAPRPVAARQSA
ncbi:MotA/TolQ/ExbB proton channel family protein [Phenylobacterium sp.]|uniref:MotA/TolQ/ExbB proton channel family protein n=1 Tax=Phenylobacterium sp. TaxID=1871053 RepID=UPI002E36E019|nr:MotA/TolQ/ExbB proton channel family protein [Phenylobacterium sp.]HEX2561338.1 MotA/TolQ/ExbB proton channel family protein [Phenylobacterium sp.]